MPIPFSKYHGLGNDFILIEGPPQPLSPEAVRTICDRHFGVGADGILIVSPNPTHDAQMIVLNADGSRPEMCGNGLRCVALHVASRATSHPTSLQLQIATDAGTKTCSLSFDPNCTIADVQIDMGFVSTPQPQTLECHDHTVELFTSSIGNPHATLINPHSSTSNDSPPPSQTTQPSRTRPMSASSQPPLTTSGSVSGNAAPAQPSLVELPPVLPPPLPSTMDLPQPTNPSPSTSLVDPSPSNYPPTTAPS